MPIRKLNCSYKIGETLNQLVLPLIDKVTVESHSTAQINLVEMLLRSRKIGRAPIGHHLAGIYLEIYDCLRQQLHKDLMPALQNFDRTDSRSWTSNLLQQASQTILTDKILKALALEAQSHPPRSPLRRHALVQLVEAIRLSGRLAHPHRAKFSPRFYDLLYEEAINQTLVYVCQRIDTYDPQRGQARKFMNWVNFRLDRMIIESRRQFSDRNTQPLPNLNDLETLPQPEQISSLLEVLRDFITADRDRVFQSTHVRNKPEASFRSIALARMDGKRWDEISEALSVKIPTISSFFRRCCLKFSTKFEELL